jgi:molecular chaperone DnaK (HSP70)
VYPDRGTDRSGDRRGGPAGGGCHRVHVVVVDIGGGTTEVGVISLAA